MYTREKYARLDRTEKSRNDFEQDRAAIYLILFYDKQFTTNNYNKLKWRRRTEDAICGMRETLR